MNRPPFGNDPAKIERYQTFWNRDPVTRPLVGFTLVGWFPLEEFAVCRSWRSDYVTPEMVRPKEFLEDHLRVVREGEMVDDDLIRGASPALVTIPWLPAILGCPLRLLPQSVLGEELRLSWEEALAVRLNRGSPWYRKYMEFTDALVRAADGEFPVSHSPDLGPTDIHAVLRGHSESILDLQDEPEKSARLLARCGEIFRDIFIDLWRRIPLFHGGYYDAQYSLWSPGPIIRMQEDATSVYSPALYRKLVQPVDRWLASQFPSNFIHLHSTSMFLLDAFLEIEEIRCFEVNNDVGGPPIERMASYYRRIQEAGKLLLVRGSFTPGELRVLMDQLEPRGLFLNIMVRDMKEIETLRPLVGMS